MYERTGIAPASVAPATFQQLILQVYPVATFVVAVGTLGKFQAKTSKNCCFTTLATAFDHQTQC